MTRLVYIFLFLTLLSSNANAQNEESKTSLFSVGASYLTLSKENFTNNLWGGEISYVHTIGGKGCFGGNLLYNVQSLPYVSTTIISLQPEFRNYFGESALKGFYLAFNAEYQSISTTFKDSNGGTRGGATGDNFGMGTGFGYNPSFGNNISGVLKGAIGYIFNEGGSLRWNLGAGIAFRF